MRMKHLPIMLASAIAPFFLACDLLDLFAPDSGGGISESEVARGLQEALSVGIDSANARVSKINGYLLNQAIKILLPSDVQTVLAYSQNLYNAAAPYLLTLQAVGIDPLNLSSLNGAGESLMVSMNHAAEKAAPRSVGIFKSAIFALTIPKAMDILHGDSIAATSYLKGETYDSLTGLYKPFIDSTLALVHANQYWQSIAQSYNTIMGYYHDAAAVIPGVLPVPPYNSLSTDLSRYTTTKALDGLFYMVGREETRIRKDPIARVTELLKEVFGLLD
jgi:hypothetical protein